jgi:protocatechuate 4,5-dioxygenase beta chain
MARVIGGIGTSHIPQVGVAYDRKLQETPEWKPLFDGYLPAQEWLARRQPDVAIVIYNDHGADLSIEKMPTFAVGVAENYPPGDEGWGPRPLPPAQGDPDLSWHIVESLVESEFDPMIAQELALDHGFLVPMNLLWPGDWPVRVVPIAVNVIQHPVPTALRCYKLGKALRAALEAYPSDQKIVVIGTGGMSHQLHGERVGYLNRTFDNYFLDTLETDPYELTKISRRDYMEKAGAEAIELIMWLTMRAALNDDVKRVHRFYLTPVSLSSAGLIVLEN